MTKRTIIILDEDGKEISRETGTIVIASVGDRRNYDQDVISACAIVHGEYKDIARSYLALGSNIHSRFAAMVDKPKEEVKPKPRKRVSGVKRIPKTS